MNFKVALSRNCTHELAVVFPIRDPMFFVSKHSLGSLDQAVSGRY